jgi:hypothetical protein
MGSKVLYDEDARELAAIWHGGGGSAVYVLASTGAISDATVQELTREVQDLRELVKEGVYEERDVDEVVSLLDYVIASGNRGEVRGWNDMEWHEGL